MYPLLVSIDRLIITEDGMIVPVYWRCVSEQVSGWKRKGVVTGVDGVYYLKAKVGTK